MSARRYEREYEDWLAVHPEVIGPEGTYLLARQLTVGTGGILDLLFWRAPFSHAPFPGKCALSVVEVKRDKAGLKALAQAAGYAHAVADLIQDLWFTVQADRVIGGVEVVLAAPRISRQCATVMSATDNFRYLRVTSEFEVGFWEECGRAVEVTNEQVRLRELTESAVQAEFANPSSPVLW